MARRLRRAVLVALAVLIAGLLAPTAAMPVACACSCAPPANLRDWVRGYDAVFVGTPTAKSTVGSGNRQQDIYGFDVSAIYTGDVAIREAVATSSFGPACGSSFVLDDEIVVFAKRAAPGEAPTGWTTFACSPSGKPSAPLADAIRAVYGEPRAPVPDAVTEEPVAAAPTSSGTVARLVGTAAGGTVLVAMVVAGFIVWRRRRA